ncbi:MAG: ROK family transcriptional regulator [Clostridia bacterium]|nr:ROK family transcriptional regulator [Clostridia bacterium]
MINATNANTMKEKNRRLVLDLIRKNEYSRADLAKETSLTKAAVSIIVDDLIKTGVVSEFKSAETGIGRRPLCLKLNPDSMYAVGINITRSSAEVGIIDISGRIVCKNKVDVYPKKEALKQIVECIASMVKENAIDTERIYGIGVTAPGPVDSLNTTILNPTNFDEWHYENIGLRLKKALKTEVYLENVSGGLALCEKYFGIAKELNDFLLLIVSDGIGSGIMSSGKLLRNATELGHTSIAYDGIPCECGNVGCIEKYASIPAMLKGTKYADWNAVIEAEDAEIIEKEAEYLSCAIVNAINLFGFDSIILEGEINYRPQAIIDAIEKRLKNNTITRTDTRIFSGSAFSGVLCAAVTVFDNYFKFE